MIAGSKELETFLAQLNDLANEHQVVVSSTAPGAVERASVPLDASDASAIGDPLLMQGLEKRSARIQVEGVFVQVLDFLRSLEKLDVFVVTNDLSVVAAPSSNGEVMKVRLGLTLFAYGAVNSASPNDAL